MGGDDKHDRFTADHCVPTKSRRWTTKGTGAIVMSGIVDTKIIYNQTSAMKMPVKIYAQQTRRRRVWQADPICPAAKKLSNTKYMIDLFMTGIPFCYYHFKDFYGSSEADPTNFKQWDTLTQEEKKNKNEYECHMPYLRQSQIKMLKDGLPHEFESYTNNQCTKPKNQQISIKSQNTEKKSKKLKKRRNGLKEPPRPRVLIPACNQKYQNKKN